MKGPAAEPICPCDRCSHPRAIANPPGLAALDYRVGDYTSFRQALLQALPDEFGLAEWRPTAEADLGVQLLEWWAYLADVLTFYNERAIHEALLRTAVLPESVRRIVRTLGYRPRPAIGATGVVAAIADSVRPFVVPAGFPLQGTVGPRKPPQVFEVDEDVEVGRLGARMGGAARLPAIPGTATTWSGYATRDSRGRLRNRLPARPVRDPELKVKAGKPLRIAFQGVVTTVKPDDLIVFVKRGWTGDLAGRAIALVRDVTPSWDARGRAITTMMVTPGEHLPDGALRKEYKILKPTKLAHLWLYHERYPGPRSPSPLSGFLQGLETLLDPGGLFTGGMSNEPPQDAHALSSTPNPPPHPQPEGVAHLEAITRGISPGDPVLLDQRISLGPLGMVFDMMEAAARNNQDLADQIDSLRRVRFLAKVNTYSEMIWFANPPEGDRIGQGPPVGPPGGGLLKQGASPLPIPHSRITFNDPRGFASAMSLEDTSIGTVVVHYGWQEIGLVIDAPADEPTTTPEVPPSDSVPPNNPLPVLIEDATGNGVLGHLGRANQPGGPLLVPPLEALINLLPVSRGQTVEEVVGSGDPTIINQEFALKRWPLTYLRDSGPRAPDGYRSTLRVWVDGVEWHEVQSFFEQPPDARVFVTREDDEQVTHVRFGDGEWGARLPAGVDNVVATYRFGGGAESPPAGGLTTVMRPIPELRGIRNPIAVGGGEDPDPPSQIRRLAPRSVLAFGRAISGDDYATIAAQTPGVKRAAARWGWDPASQRSLVHVYVGDDEAAVTAAREALQTAVDPNRPVHILLASPIYLDVRLILETHPDHLEETVQAAATAALLDRAREPFGLEVARIGDAVYDSQIYDLCLEVPGVVTVHGLEVSVPVVAPVFTLPPLPAGWPIFLAMFLAGLNQETLVREAGARHVPGDGRFYLLRPDRLHITTRVWRHGG